MIPHPGEYDIAAIILHRVQHSMMLNGRRNDPRTAHIPDGGKDRHIIAFRASACKKDGSGFYGQMPGHRLSGQFDSQPDGTAN